MLRPSTGSGRQEHAGAAGVHGLLQGGCNLGKARAALNSGNASGRKPWDDKGRRLPMPTGLRIVLVMTAILLAPGFAAAQNAPPGDDDRVKAWAHTCGDAAAPLDAVIRACTGLIESGSRQPLDQAYAKRGAAYFLRKQDQEAMADFDRWVKLTPGDAQAYLNRGHLFFAEQRYEPAIKDYDHAITLEPENIAAWLGRGRAYFKAGYTDAPGRRQPGRQAEPGRTRGPRPARRLPRRQGRPAARPRGPTGRAEDRSGRDAAGVGVLKVRIGITEKRRERFASLSDDTDRLSSPPIDASGSLLPALD